MAECIFNKSDAATLGAALSSPSKVLVTLNGDGAAMHSMHDDSALTSYPLGASGKLRFLCPVVCNPAAERLFAAVSVGEAKASNNILLSWDLKDPNAKTWDDVTSRIPLPAKPKSLHVLSSKASSGCTVVVLQDGQVGCVTGSESQELLLLGSGQATASSLISASSCGLQLALLHTAKGGVTSITHYQFSPASASLTLVRDISVSRPGKAVARSVSLGLGFALIKWSSGVVSLVHGLSTEGGAPNQVDVQVSSETSPSGAASQPAAHTPRKKAGRDDHDVECTSVFGCAPVDGTQFIVASMDVSLSTLTYALHDQQFGCTVSQGSVLLESGSPNSGEDKQFEIIADSETAGQFLVVLNGAVMVVKLEAEPATLLSLLGRLKLGSSYQASIGDSLATMPYATSTVFLSVAKVYQDGGAAAGKGAQAGGYSMNALDRVIVRGPNEEKVAKNAEKAARKLLTQLLAASAALPVKVPGLDALLRQAVAHVKLSTERETALPVKVLGLEALLRQAVAQVKCSTDWETALPIRVFGLDALLKQAVAHVKLNTERGDKYLPPMVLLSTCVSLLCEEKMWDDVGELLKLLPDSSLVGCEDLLPAIALAQQFGPPPAMLDATNDPTLPPPNIAARKQLYESLRAQAETLIKRGNFVDPKRASLEELSTTVAQAKCAAAVVDGFSYSEVLLHSVLASPVDSVEIQACVKPLGNAQVDRLLCYLSKWVDKYTTALGDGAAHVAVPVDLLFPTLLQVTNWIKSTVDAHLGRLLMASTPCPHLELISNRLGVQVPACEKLVALKGATDHVRSQAPLPAAHIAAATQYTVEVIDLRLIPVRA
eukprot:gene11494-34211_t